MPVCASPNHAGGKAAAVDRAGSPRRGGAAFRPPSATGATQREPAKTARVAVVLSLFLVVLAAGLLIGGHAVIDPMLQSAAERREAHRIGDIVFSMRDGLLCRHLSFDNKTAAMTEGAVEPCEPDLAKERTAAVKSFAWGER